MPSWVCRITGRQVENEKHKEYLSAIISSGQTLLSLINDILDLSKIEAGKMEISYKPTSLIIFSQILKEYFPKESVRRDWNF